MKPPDDEPANDKEWRDDENAFAGALYAVAIWLVVIVLAAIWRNWPSL